MGCQRASEQMKTATGKTIAGWYRDFHQGKECDEDPDKIVVVERFPWSLRGRLNKTAVKSPLDAEFGDEQLTMRFKTWAKENLEELSVERARLWFTAEIGDWSFDELSAYNIVAPLQKHTVANWMRDAGFVYSQYKKSYAVNTHERPDVVEARRDYVFSYLEDEINQAVWIQLPIEKARRSFKRKGGAEVKEDNLYWKYRHEYFEGGQQMVELPVFAF